MEKIREEDKSPPPSSPPPLFSVIPGGFIRQLVRETEKESKEARRRRQEALAAPDRGTTEAPACQPHSETSSQHPDIPGPESQGSESTEPSSMATINGEKPLEPGSHGAPVKRTLPFKRGVRGGDVLLMVARLDPELAKPEQRPPPREAPARRTSTPATDPGGAKKGVAPGLPCGTEDAAPKAEKTQSGASGDPRTTPLTVDEKGATVPQTKSLGRGEPQDREGPEGAQSNPAEGGGPPKEVAKDSGGKGAGPRVQGRKWGLSLGRRGNWGGPQSSRDREAEGDRPDGLGAATETGRMMRAGEKVRGPQSVSEKPGGPQSVSEKTGGPQSVSEKPRGPQTVSEKTGGPQSVSEKTGGPQSVSEKTGRPQSVSEKPGGPQSVSEKIGGPQSVSEKTGRPQSVSEKPRGPQTVSEKTGGPQSVSEKSGGPQSVSEKPGEPQNVSKKTGPPKSVLEKLGVSQSAPKKTGTPPSVPEKPGAPQSMVEKSKGALSVSRKAGGPQRMSRKADGSQGESREAAETGGQTEKDRGTVGKVEGDGEPLAAEREARLDGGGREAEAPCGRADPGPPEPEECGRLVLGDLIQVPELQEDQQGPTGDQSRDLEQAPEDRWYEAEKVWLVRKDGFELATVLKPDEGTADLPAGKVRLCLDADKTIREVDEEHVHRANPPELDQAEDLASLLSVNESSVLHTLLCRHRAQLQHTRCGPDLIFLQPQGGPTPSAGKVPPLICSLARRAYQALLSQRQDQSVVALGRSGAGKTTCCQQVLEQLVRMAGSVDSCVSVEKIQAIFTVLRAFGCVPAAHSRCATRFSMVMSLDFNASGRIMAAQLQTLLLEKSLVARRPEGEGSFQVFSQMLAGLNLEQRTELSLHLPAESSSFRLGTWATPEDKQRAAEAFAQLRAAMDTLGILGSEQQAVWRVLAAIYHLGIAGACKVGRKQFMRFEWANHAAEALGCGYEELTTATFKHHLRQIIQQVTSGPGQRHHLGEEDASPGLKMTGVECVEGMASGLYEELFTAVVSLINRSLCSPHLCTGSISVVDGAGFQNPRHRGGERAAGLDELCRNYAHERLQLLRHQRAFLTPLERAREEGVPLRFEAPECSPGSTVAVVDQTPSQVRLPVGGGAEDSGGLFWILDQEVRAEGSSDSLVLERLRAAFEKTAKGAEGAPALRMCEQPLQCEIAHQLGHDPVRYNLAGWLHRAKPNPAALEGRRLLRQSTREELRSLFGSRAELPLACGALGGLEGGSQQAQQRNRVVRRTFAGAAAAVRRRARCSQVALQADALTNIIQRSQLHFIHCLVAGPGPENGDTQSTPSLPQPDIPGLRAQLSGFHLLEVLRAHRAGYADHMGLAQFRRRFQALDPELCKKLAPASERVDERKAVEELLQTLDLDKAAVAVGHSQVFLKAGVVSRLEKQREKLVSQVIVLFQATCKGFLSRQEFKKLKIRRLATQCIQKNMAVFLGIKDWPWWQLLGSLRPLLSASVGDEQLHAKEEELAQLRKKLEKSEKARRELRQGTDQLEGKITDLTTELDDERFKGDVICQALESERAERLRLAREVQEVKDKYEQVQRTLGDVRKQLEEAQQKVKLSDLERSQSGRAEGADEWQMRLDCAQTENEFLRKRLQQCEERLDSELSARKELEQKLGDLQSTYEGAKMAAHQLKRKCRHLTCDLEDTRLLLENQQSRNHELEKKQKKFDMQLAQALGEAVFEKGLREKVAQENSSVRWQLGQVQKQLKQKEQASEQLQREVETLRAHERELLSDPSLGGQGLPELKQRLWQLEAEARVQHRVQSQQEGTIRQQEQFRQRLELELERMKQMHQKDLEDQEEELEDVRQSCQKRLRQLEAQLEQEHEEKQLVLHEKQDLEGLIGTLCDQIGHRDFDVERRLRRDLKRTHALLSDVQQLLGTMEDGKTSVSKEELDRVQSQLEQSEAKCEDALKTQKALTAELENMHTELESVTRSKNLVDEQLHRLQFEQADLLKRIDEDQDDLNDLMQKHKDLIAQSAADIGQIQELQQQLEEATKERRSLQEQLQVAQMRVEYLEQSTVDRAIVSRQEAAICDLENKTEFQKVQIKRFEVLVIRLRDSLIKMGEEFEQASVAEAQQRESSQYYQRRLEEMKAEMEELGQREAEAGRRCLELEKCVEELAAVRLTLQGDLETSIRRIADLQAALEEAASSDSDGESVKTAVDCRARKETDDASSLLGSQAEGSLQSWLSCTLSLPTDGLRTPSRQSALGHHSSSPRTDEEVSSARRTPWAPSQTGDVRSKTLGVGSPSSSPASLGRQKPFPSEGTGDNGTGPRPEGRDPAPAGRDELPSPSAALSEFVEGLRRSRGRRGAPELLLEDCPAVPIYRTTGAASLRRARAGSEQGTLSPKSEGVCPLEPAGLGCASSSEKASGLLRSSSLRCLSLASSGPGSPLLPESQKARFSSCECLAGSGSGSAAASSSPSRSSSPSPLPGDRLLSPTLRPRRRCLEASLEEAGCPDLGKEPLVFQNRQFAHLMREAPGQSLSGWQTPGRADFDDFLPAIRKPRTPSPPRPERRSIVQFETEDADRSFPAGTGPALRKSPDAPEDSARLSDSSSSSDVSLRSSGSVKSRPRVPRAQGDGGETASSPQNREWGAGKAEDVVSIMKKYLQK